MIISDTSALVLNWTLKDIWKSEGARAYFTGLDLRAADPLFKKFGDEENFIQTHLLSNRKFFVRKCAVEFAEECKAKHITAQVIILAAGIDPLSVEIASLYPNSIIFDVDKYQMKEKRNCLHEYDNIRFIECDITDIEFLKLRLVLKGWNRNRPTMLIMEGIMYYLTEDDIKKVLTSLSQYVSLFVCDIGLQPEFVNKKYRAHGVETRKKIMETVGLDFMNCFEPHQFIQIVKQSGFDSVQMVMVGDIQEERTGKRIPFDSEEPSAWVTMIKADNYHSI
jgi:O-methyltransferase involved in polyketide biosynthesis